MVELRKEGKTYQQIAKELRVSVRSIKPILDKYGVDDIADYPDGDGKENDSALPMSISSRAYKLFYEEGMTPLEVAIALNIEAPEAIRYHNEFLELNNRGTLVRLQMQVGNEGVLWLLRLVLIAKTKGMKINDIIECVSIYRENLPIVKKMHEDANNGLQTVLNRKYQSEKECEFLDFKINKLVEVLRSKQAECENIERERRKLLRLRMQLTSFISEVRNKNITYREIEQLVEEKVDSILRNNMQLLKLSLISLLRSLGKDELYKYKYLLHEMNLVEIPGSIDDDLDTSSPFLRSMPNTTVVKNYATTTHSQNSTDRYYHSYKQKRDDHCPACYESYILAVSNRYFENLKKQMTKEVMSAIIEGKAYSEWHNE